MDEIKVSIEKEIWEQAVDYKNAFEDLYKCIRDVNKSNMKSKGTEYLETFARNKDKELARHKLS